MSCCCLQVSNEILDSKHKPILNEFYFYLVIDEALRGVEVEGEDDSGPFEDDDLVVLVLARNVPRIGGQPTVLFFEAKQSVKKKNERYWFNQFSYFLCSNFLTCMVFVPNTPTYQISLKFNLFTKMKTRLTRKTIFCLNKLNIRKVSYFYIRRKLYFTFSTIIRFQYKCSL